MAITQSEDRCSNKKMKLDPEKDVNDSVKSITEYTVTKCIGQSDDGRAIFTLGNQCCSTSLK